LSLKNRDTDEVIITVVEDKDNAIFVSYDIGDDSNDGSPDAPVQTRALYLLRKTITGGKEGIKFYSNPNLKLLMQPTRAQIQ